MLCKILSLKKDGSHGGQLINYVSQSSVAEKSVIIVLESSTFYVCVSPGNYRFSLLGFS